MLQLHPLFSMDQVEVFALSTLLLPAAATNGDAQHCAAWQIPHHANYAPAFSAVCAASAVPQTGAGITMHFEP